MCVRTGGVAMSIHATLNRYAKQSLVAIVQLTIITKAGRNRGDEEAKRVTTLGSLLSFAQCNRSREEHHFSKNNQSFP